MEELQQVEMEEKKFCNVDAKLLPIKSHFFFFYGGMAGVIPFLPVLAKGLGISATAVGLVYTALPFCVFFSKPLFGYVTDLFRDIRAVVLALAAVTAAAYLAVLLVPALQPPWAPVWPTECREEGVPLTGSPFKPCTQTKEDQYCDLKFTPCGSQDPLELHGKIIPSFNSSQILEFIPDTNFTCGCISDNSTFLRCSDPCDHTSVYKTFQFWVFTLLVVIGGTGSATVFCLSDAACYEVLGDRPQHYGRQRLWATISWGLVTLLAGLFNDLASAGGDEKTYAPGFYLMLAMVVVDLLLLFKIRLTKANFSISICKDIGEIFSSLETVVFAVAVYIIGALTGLIWNYQFWFLEDLGATQTLLGLTVAVQCLAAEVPFFFFAGWFIRKLGHFYCLTGSFAAFALRLALYFVIREPWAMLPVELLHGVTFAVFYAAMTGYASHSAPPGTEATMIGIFGGLFEGLGVATGSLLGGVGFDKLGGRDTFLVASLISLVCVPTFAVVPTIVKKCRLSPPSDLSS